MLFFPFLPCYRGISFLVTSMREREQGTMVNPSHSDTPHPQANIPLTNQQTRRTKPVHKSCIMAYASFSHKFRRPLFRITRTNLFFSLFLLFSVTRLTSMSVFTPLPLSPPPLAFMSRLILTTHHAIR